MKDFILILFLCGVLAIVVRNVFEPEDQSAAFVPAEEQPSAQPAEPAPVQEPSRPTPAERRQGAVERPAEPPLTSGLAGKISVVQRRESTTGPLPDSLAGLEDAAVAGSDRAAEELQKLLDLCQHMPKTPDELRALQTKARESYSATGGVALGEYVGTLDEQLAHWRKYYERCQGSGVPGVQERTLELLRESADRGDWRNSLLYAQVLNRTDPEQGRALLEALAAKGSVGALASLGEHSLPHKLAHLYVYIAMVKSDEDFREALREIESTTSPTEYRAAEQEAARILSNPACCKL